MLRRLDRGPPLSTGATARAGGDATRPSERRVPHAEERGNRCFVLSALSVCVVVLLAWNFVLVSAINGQPGISEDAARRIAAGGANALPVVAAAPAVQAQHTVVASEDLALVANEVIALRTWASNIVDSNKRLASAYGSIELPASATAAERASFEALSVEVSAAMAQSIAVGAAVEETVRKPLALLPTPSPRIWCLVPVVWPRDNALIDVLRKTWGAHCDVLKFAVDRRDYVKHNLAARTELAALFMPLDLKHAAKPNVDHGWEKVWRMWAAVGAKHASEGDFFLKANTGTFVAVDNLRAFLRYYDAEQKHYLGHTILSKWRADNVKYNAAAGYVLSRASLVALAPKLAQMKAGGNSKRDCTDHAGESEDVSLSVCLRAVGILPGDTLDSRGRQRFMLHPAGTELSLFRSAEDWYWSHKPADVGEGAHCCSKFPILFDGHWGGKYRGDEYRRRFEELDYILFDAVGGSHAHRDVEPPSLGLFRYDADSLTFKINEARDSCRVVDCKAPPPAPVVNARYSRPPKLDHLRFFGTATLLDDGSEGGVGGGGGTSVAGLRKRTGRAAMEPLRDDERFLSFEYYPGRLNNQLWTLDWAFRCAKAMGRTLYISRPTQQVQYVGLPDRRDDEVGDALRAVLWDMQRLRSAFRFVLQHELDGSPALSGASATLLSSNPGTLSADCVWKDGADIYIAQWMAAPQRNGTGKCRRLHLMTNHGMVHAWRTATRTWGVGPFAFFNAMRPARYLRNAVKTWIAAASAEHTISVHSRAFNAYKAATPAGVPFAACQRLSMMTVNKAIAHLNADKKCCAADPLYPDGRPPLAHTQWAEGFSRYASSTAAKDSSAASFGIFKTDGTPRPIGEALSEFAAEQLIGTCHYTKAFYDRAANWLVGEATAQRSTVFIVSDHQWDEVDKFMRDDVKALSYATAELGAFMKRSASAGGSRTASAPPGRQGWYANLETSVLDMLVLADADYMIGGPGSTFSKTVCMWRGVDKLAKSNMCFLVLLEAATEDCRSIACKAA